MNKTALITGVSGQDGAYLSQLLLSKGYRVIGTLRSHSRTLSKLKYLGVEHEVEVVELDLLDVAAIFRILKKYRPCEVYNLAAQSSVGASFSQPLATFTFNTMSVINLLETIRLVDENIRLYQASSSEMYGRVNSLPITENTPMHPVSPYAVSKASAHWMAINYRESYNLFVGTGILFNHESVLRGDNFLIKKVIRSAINISNGTQENLKLGNIEISRDFGFAEDYVEAMWRILQADKPSDFLICSGQSIKLKDIVHYVFDKLSVSKNKIILDPELYRPNEIPDIFGCPSKAENELGWSNNKSFYDVLDIIINEEKKLLSQ